MSMANSMPYTKLFAIYVMFTSPRRLRIHIIKQLQMAKNSWNKIKFLNRNMQGRDLLLYVAYDLII